MRLKRGCQVFVLIVMGLPMFSFAFLPVVDPGAIANLVKQFNQLQQQYALLKQQLVAAKEIQQDAEGHYGFGRFLNAASDLKNREWSPDSWQDALKGVSGGNARRYQELVAEYKKNHPVLSQDQMEKGVSRENAVIYAHQVKVNQAASVNATYAFNEIKKHMDSIHAISEKIESAKNTKSAVDLNTRMQTEIAYVQVQMLKQMAILNEQMARNSADQIDDETQSSQFNRLPEN